MKTFLTILCLAVAVYATAQTTIERPRSEFAFSLSDDKITLEPGKSKTVTVTVLRSKSYAKEKAHLGTMSTPAQGLSVTFNENDDTFESATATISVAADMPAGDYTVALSATLNHKKKGALIKVTVGGEAVAKN